MSDAERISATTDQGNLKKPLSGRVIFHPLPGVLLGLPILVYLVFDFQVTNFKLGAGIEEFSFLKEGITALIIGLLIYCGSFLCTAGSRKARQARRFAMAAGILTVVGFYSYGKGQPRLYYRCNDGQVTVPFRGGLDRPEFIAGAMKSLGCKKLEMHLALWHDEVHLNHGVIAFAMIFAVTFLIATIAALFSQRLTLWVFGAAAGIELIAAVAFFSKLY